MCYYYHYPLCIDKENHWNFNNKVSEQYRDMVFSPNGSGIINYARSFGAKVVMIKYKLSQSPVVPNQFVHKKEPFLNLKTTNFNTNLTPSCKTSFAHNLQLIETY